MKKIVLLTALVILIAGVLFIFSKSEFQESEQMASEPSPIKTNEIPSLPPPQKTVVESSPDRESLTSPISVSTTDLGNVATVVENQITFKSPLAENMAELKLFIDSLKIDPENDPEGLDWNAGLSALDVKLQDFLDDPTLGREEKINNLWDLVNQLEYGTPASYVIDSLSKLRPFEINSQIIDMFQTVATQGDASTIRQLELLSLLKAGINVPRDNLTTADQIEQFEQAVVQTKVLLSQQLYDYSHAAVFKESLSLYYDIATLPESIETFPKIADAVASDQHLKKDFYAIWAQSIFAHPQLQPAVEILFNSQLPKSDRDEVNFEVYDVLKNISSGDIAENVRNELIDYVRQQEPLRENASDYLKWMSAYVAIQSPDETTRNISLGHLIANDKANDVLLQAHAVEFWGSETILSTWENKDVALLVNNLQKAVHEQQLSPQDQSFIQSIIYQLEESISTP